MFTIITSAYVKPYFLAFEFSKDIISICNTGIPNLHMVLVMYKLTRGKLLHSHQKRDDIKFKCC